MARVLILSSFVAASRVGGSAQALALARQGIEPILVPTVLFGRHPGHGPPGGGPVAAETMGAMLGAVEAQGLFGKLDAAITGYFATVEQVAIAADALSRIEAAAPATRIVVDPVMGDDDKGLYVNEAAAVAIAERLVPLADLVCPNAWELGRLTGRTVTDASSALAAARRLGRTVVASSIASNGDIGVLYADRTVAWLASHPRSAVAPRGVGDLLTAYLVAGLVKGLPARDALSAAVGALAEIGAGANGEDPAVDALATVLAPSPSVRLEAIDG